MYGARMCILITDDSAKYVIFLNVRKLHSATQCLVKNQNTVALVVFGLVVVGLSYVHYAQCGYCA